MPLPSFVGHPPVLSTLNGLIAHGGSVSAAAGQPGAAERVALFATDPPQVSERGTAFPRAPAAVRPETDAFGCGALPQVAGLVEFEPPAFVPSEAAAVPVKKEKKAKLPAEQVTKYCLYSSA